MRVGVAVASVLGLLRRPHAAPLHCPLHSTPRDPFGTPQKPRCRLAVCLPVEISGRVYWRCVASSTPTPRPHPLFLYLSAASFPPLQGNPRKGGDFFPRAEAWPADPADYLAACRAQPLPCLRSPARQPGRRRSRRVSVRVMWPPVGIDPDADTWLVWRWQNRTKSGYSGSEFVLSGVH